MNLRSRFKVVAGATLIMTLICALLLGASFFLSFDKSLGYFEGGIFPSLFKAFYAVTVGYIILSSIIYINRKKTVSESDELPVYFKVIAISAGAVVIVFALLELLSARYGMTTYDKITYVGLISFGAFLIIVSFMRGFEYHLSKLVLLCLASLFPIGLTLSITFDFYHTVNSVQSVLFVCFAISFLIYILYEGKRLVSDSVPAFYLPSLLLAFLTSATLSLAYVAAYIGKALTDGAYLERALILLAAAMYFGCAILHYVSSVEEATVENAEEEPKESTKEESDESKD